MAAATIDYTASPRPVIIGTGDNTAAAITAAAAAQASAVLARASWRKVANAAERNAIPSDERTYGLHVYVVDQDRVYVWTEDGVDGADGWVSRTNQGDFTFIINNIDNALDAHQGQIETLNTGATNLAARATALEALRISALSATALSMAPAPPVSLSWALDGSAPDYQTVEWGGWKFEMDGSARGLSVADWAASKAAMVLSDSMGEITGYGTWPATLATALGLTIYAPAKGASGPRQIYRSGAVPLYLTVSGNALPAGGTNVAVTSINGVAPSTSGFDNGLNYPMGFLNSYPGDSAQSMTGTYAGRRVTVSISAGDAVDYTMAQDAGLPAVNVPAQALFVPDYAAQLDQAELWIMLSNNYYYSGVAGDHINPQVYADITAIIRRARGQRIMIFGITGGPSIVVGSPEHTALLAFNAGLASRWPQYYVRDAMGRDTLARLLASGNGGTNDNTDVANGVVPRSLRVGDTDPHLNSAGNAVVVALAQEYRALQAIPPALSLTSAITLKAYAGVQSAMATVKPEPSGLLAAFAALPVYANNAAAIAGGLSINRLYRTASGQIQIVY